MAEILFTRGPDSKNPFLIGELITVGRAADNHIILDDPTVSGHHARIFAHGDTFVLRDMGSSNGTKVNGKQISEASIADGDRLTFGSVESVFRNPMSPKAKNNSYSGLSSPDIRRRGVSAAIFGAVVAVMGLGLGALVFTFINAGSHDGRVWIDTGSLLCLLASLGGAVVSLRGLYQIVIGRDSTQDINRIKRWYNDLRGVRRFFWVSAMLTLFIIIVLSVTWLFVGFNPFR